MTCTHCGRKYCKCWKSAAPSSSIHAAAAQPLEEDRDTVIAVMCDFTLRDIFPTWATKRKEGEIFRQFCFACKKTHFYSRNKIHFRFTISRCWGCGSRCCKDNIEKRFCSESIKKLEMGQIDESIMR